METKSAVSTLQEYCAQTKDGPPVYEYIDGEDGGYICKVTLLDMEAFGNGRSKRDAKHLAAANIMRKIRKLPKMEHLFGGSGDINEVADELTNLNRDMLKELRDYCVRHEMPLPTIEIVQQSGTPNAPEFLACCSVASIKRYGKSDKKKDARQRAAIEMLCVIANEGDVLVRPDNMQLVSTNPSPMDVESNVDDVEAERRIKFKTYRELTEAGSTDNTGVRLCDRHNYFKKFHQPLKDAAFEVILSDEYMTSKDKALGVLSALKLTPRITQLEAQSMEPMLQIELNCDFDVLFLGLESKIYDQIIDYFSEMLT